MRRSVLRAVESAKPLARVPRSVSRSFATEGGSKVNQTEQPGYDILMFTEV